MGGIIEMLKSRGKFGAIGLMAIGIGLMAFSFFKGTGQYQEGAGTFFMGLSLLGIRSKQG